MITLGFPSPGHAVPYQFLAQGVLQVVDAAVLPKCYGDRLLSQALASKLAIQEYLLIYSSSGPKVDSPRPTPSYSPAWQRSHPPRWPFPRQARHTPEAPPPRSFASHRPIQSQRRTITTSQCEICHCYECESGAERD